MTPFAPLHVRIAAHADAAPARAALVFGKTQIGYELFSRRIAGTAHSLREVGVERGDRVILCAANSPELAIGYFGIHAAGATACPLPADTAMDALTELRERVGAKLVLTDRQQIEGAATLDITEAEAAAGPDVTLEADDPADILFTSGTSGERKGVVLTHRNIAAAAENISSFIGNGRDDLEAVPLPLSHSFGLGRLRSLAHVGNGMLLAKGLGNPPMLIKQMLARKASGLALVPAGVEILRRTLGDHLSRLAGQLRYMEIGSAPMPPETRDWLLAMLPETRICHHYGLTEASRAAFLDLREAAAHPDRVGRATPGVTIGVTDENGELLAPGAEGEITISGAVVAARYLDDEPRTRAHMRAEGFRTGDVGSLDEDGYLRLSGRRDDLINVGGKKVAPEAVERVLAEVDGVHAAACIGTADPEGILGEVVVAFIESGEPLDEEALRDHSELRLPSHERPVRFMAIETLPRTQSGKLQRAKLRESIKSPF